jgi:hypothetical protein
MTDSQHTYYFLPSDVISLLINYLPRHRFEIYKQIPFLQKYIEPLLPLTRNYIICDAISRNDTEYCLANFDTIYDSYATLSESRGPYWHYAVECGNLNILNLLQRIDERCSSNNHPLYLGNHKSTYFVLAYAPNIETIEWIEQHVKFDNISHTIGHLWSFVWQTIVNDKMSLLHWLHKRGYLKAYFNSFISSQIYYITGDIYIIIRLLQEKPEFYRWFLDNADSIDVRLMSILRDNPPKQ